MPFASRVDPHSRLKQTIYFKRADHLLDADIEFQEQGQIILAVDSTIAREFVERAIEKKIKTQDAPWKVTRSNLGPQLHFASLVSLFSSSIGSTDEERLLLLPGHLREVESAWNASASAIPPAEAGGATEAAAAISMAIFDAVDLDHKTADYSEVAAQIQTAFWSQLKGQRENYLYSNLMSSTLCDLSALFDGTFGDRSSQVLENAVGSPGNLFSSEDECKPIEAVLKWAYHKNDEFASLPADDKSALLSLLIVNNLLLHHKIKVVLITDSVALHAVADRFKFFYDPDDDTKFVRGAEYCVRDLKIVTNRLLRNAEVEPKPYWANIILEAATDFPVDDRAMFLEKSSQKRLESLADDIVASRDYAQDAMDDKEHTQIAYGEEISKDATIHTVERFKERDLERAERAATAFKKQNITKFLELARKSVIEEVEEARGEFIKAAVMRLVSRRSSEELDGPFKGRFFSCLYLEDHDTHHIAKAINELNEVAHARTALIKSLEATAGDADANARSSYLVLLGAAALYSDLGHWDQAKLLCDEAMLTRDRNSKFRGREAHFLSSVCHRMTVRTRDDLEKAREHLSIADKLAKERNSQLQSEAFTGLRFKAESIAIDAASLAFDVYMSKSTDDVADRVVKKIDEITELLDTGDPCPQERPKKWAEISLRCTSFSLLLLLVSLERDDLINKYKKKMAKYVRDQETAARSYFCVDGHLRVSVRDGLLILFAAEVTDTELHDHKWVSKLHEQLQSDVIGTKRLAAYLPFDGYRFTVLTERIRKKMSA